MALEAVGVLVNIAGDAGSLVSAVNKATDAFHKMSTTASKVDVTAMPAWQRLDYMVKSVDGRISQATRQQNIYKESAEKLKGTMASLKEAMSLPITGVSKKEQRDYLQGLTDEYKKQEEQLKKVTKYVTDYDDKLKILGARKDRLELEKGQVRLPEADVSKWTKILNLLSAGRDVYNVAGKMLGSLGGLFGGTGRPAFGSKDQMTDKDRMVYDKTTFSLKEMNVAAAASGPSFGVMAKAMAVGQIAATALISGFVGVINTVKNVGSSLINLGVEATKAAGRNQELGIVSQYMGKQAGHSAAEIDKVVESLKKGGASTAAANDAVTQFARSEMDLSKATDLLTVSQGAAIIAGQDSSAVMQQLIYGIVTLQPEMLRTSGIIIDAEKAYKTYAESIHVNVNALTGQQKQQAFLNETLLQGAKLQGLYAEAMKLPGKQLRTLTEREIPELIARLGIPFQDAFKTIVESARKFVGWMTEAVSSGGKLYPILEALGTAFSKVTNTVDALVKEGGKALDGMIGSWSDKMGGLIGNAGVWGSNLIVQFANGIIDGVGAVVDALSYIGSVVTYWLAPGSPPRIAPELDKWGADAMASYMSGWETADISVFDTISDKLSSFIKSLGDDIVGKAEVVPFIQSIRNSVAGLVDELEQFGKVSASTLDNLASKFGAASGVIYNYVKATLEAAAADALVAKLQDQIASVTEKYDEKLTALNKELEKYNQDTAAADEDAKLKALNRILTRVSTTEAQKEAAQKEINHINTQKQIRLTENEKKAEIDVIQIKLTAAQKEQEAANKRLAYQQALLDQIQEENDLRKEQAQILEQLAKAAEAAAKALSGAGGRGAGAGKKATPTTPQQMTGTYLPGMQGQGMGGMASPIQSVIDKLEELKGKWENFKSVWDSFWQHPQVEKVKGAFQIVWNEIKGGTPILDAADKAIKSMLTAEQTEKWNSFKTSVKNTFDMFKESVDKRMPEIVTTWDKNSQALERIWKRVWGDGSGAANAGGTLVKMIVGFFSWVFDFFVMSFANLSRLVEVVLALIEGRWGDIWGDAKGGKEGTLKRMFLDWIDTLTGEKGPFASFHTFIRGWADKVIEVIDSIVDAIKNAISWRERLDKNVPLNQQGPSYGQPGNYSPYPAYNPYEENNAEGGPAKRGKATLVGERGLEMFIPKSDGFIIPNYMIRNLIRGTMPANYITNSGGNSQVQNIRNNYLTVHSQTPSQGIVADWSRLTVLGA